MIRGIKFFHCFFWKIYGINKSFWNYLTFANIQFVKNSWATRLEKQMTLPSVWYLKDWSIFWLFCSTAKCCCCCFSTGTLQGDECSRANPGIIQLCNSSKCATSVQDLTVLVYMLCLCSMRILAKDCIHNLPSQPRQYQVLLRLRL